MDYFSLNIYSNFPFRSTTPRVVAVVPKIGNTSPIKSALSKNQSANKLYRYNSKQLQYIYTVRKYP